MPITEELENLKKFESVGFSHEQAEVLTSVIERSHELSHESLKDFIRDEHEKLIKDIDVKFSEFDNKFSKQISDLDNKFSKQINDLDNKFSKQINDLDNRIGRQINDLNSKISTLEVSLIAAQRDLLIKMFGIIVGTVGVAVTILKLF